MVNISDNSASTIINMLLEKTTQCKKEQPVDSRAEIIGSVLIALLDDNEFCMDESSVNRLGFFSTRTLVDHLLRYACNPIEEIPHENIKECIKKLEAETGIKICG